MKATGLLIALTLVLAGCDAIDAAKATKAMPEKMDRTIKTMQETECALKQGISFEAMLKEEFGRVLVPVAFDLMPFAKKFAQCSSPDDTAEVGYLWMKKMNEVTLDVSNPTPAQVEEFNHKQLHVYSALQAVAGFLPRSTVDQIINKQVYNQGAYEDTAYELLMLRATFIRDVRLENGLFSKGLTTVGRVEKAVEYAEELEYIARLPFTPLIGVTVTGFVDPFPDVKETLDPAMALKMWQKIRTKVERLNAQLNDGSQKVKVSNALGRIDQRINGWTGRP